MDETSPDSGITQSIHPKNANLTMKSIPRKPLQVELDTFDSQDPSLDSGEHEPPNKTANAFHLSTNCRLPDPMVTRGGRVFSQGCITPVGTRPLMELDKAQSFFGPRMSQPGTCQKPTQSMNDQDDVDEDTNEEPRCKHLPTRGVSRRYSNANDTIRAK